MKEFADYLERQNLSPNTIKSYVYSVKDYQSKHEGFAKKELLAYKGEIIGTYKAKTVNLRIQGLNSYLDYIKKPSLKLSYIKVQQKSYLENVISNADYQFFKNQLKKKGYTEWYFVVRFLAATGARISELVQFKAEHVIIGYIDIYSKGGKVRRIFIPKKLQKEALEWLKKTNTESGYLFKNQAGKTITTRGVAHRLKELAKSFGMNTKVIYPHSFRHLFAKNFLAKSQDIALLADLMGHESLETTRIYLRKTSEEQKEMVDNIVTW